MLISVIIFWWSGENGVTVVHTRHDEGMDERLDGVRVLGSSDSLKLAQPIKAGWADISHVIVQRDQTKLSLLEHGIAVLSTKSAGRYSTTRATLRSSFKVKGQGHKLTSSHFCLFIRETKCCTCHYRRAGHTVSAEPDGHTSCQSINQIGLFSIAAKSCKCLFKIVQRHLGRNRKREKFNAKCMKT